MDPDNPRPRLCYGLEFLRFSVLLWWVSCLTPVLVAYGQPGSLDRTFYPGSATDGPVYAIAKQQDGKLLIAGDFSIADSEVRGRVARLNADGSLDRNFGAGMQGANNWVRTVAIQADGKVLIGGDFTSINNVVRSYIARLNHDGSLDTNFTTAASAPVYSIALQNDNKILIGGRFFLVNNTNRNCAARLNENGTLDTSFTNLSPIAFGSPIVHSIAVQSNGKILIGGAFTNIAGLARANVARLESSGVPDSSFGTTNQGANSPVYSLAIQSDGRVFISGTFSAVNGTNRSGLARLNNDGSLDTGFVPALYNPYPAVTRITLTTNGQILTCGSTVWQSSTKWGITRLNNNGSLDTTFAGGFIPIDECRTILVQSDGSLIAGGGIAAASVEAGRLEVQGFIRHGVARINTDGSVDESFNSRRIGPRYHISSVAVQHDGKVLVNVGPPLPGNAVLGLPRLNLDGSLDSSFPSASLPPPRDFAVRNDGRIVIGGSFYLNRGGSIWQRIAQLLPDGSVDTNFDQGNFLYNSVERVALAPDGKIYITADSSPVILRLNENGSLDTSFNNVSVYGIDCLAVQPDNKVIVGGFFYTSSTNAPDHIARLNSDGSLDTNFAWNLSGASGYVNCVALQKDGKVLIGGDFTYFHNTPRSHIARLNSDGSLDTNFLAGLTGANGNVYAVAVRPNGKILIGGNFSVVNGLPRKNFAQINSDGSLDTNFVATSFNSSIFDISVSPDDRIVAAGAFTAIGGMGQHYVARLYGDSPPLNLVPTGPNFFQLFWPSGWTGFTPQQSSGINSGWVSFPPIPTNDGTNWSISFFATNSSQIFRLIR